MFEMEQDKIEATYLSFISSATLSATEVAATRRGCVQIMLTSSPCPLRSLTVSSPKNDIRPRYPEHSLVASEPTAALQDTDALFQMNPQR